MECKLISRYSPLFVLFLASLVNAQTGRKRDVNNLYQVIYYGDSQTEVGKPFAISCIISIADPVEWHKDGEPLRKHSNIRHGKDEHSYIESEMGIAGNRDKIEATISVQRALPKHQGRYQCNSLYKNYHMLYVHRNTSDGSEKMMPGRRGPPESILDKLDEPVVGPLLLTSMRPPLITSIAELHHPLSTPESGPLEPLETHHHHHHVDKTASSHKPDSGHRIKEPLEGQQLGSKANNHINVIDSEDSTPDSDKDNENGAIVTAEDTREEGPSGDGGIEEAPPPPPLFEDNVAPPAIDEDDSVDEEEASIVIESKDVSLEDSAIDKMIRNKSEINGIIQVDDSEEQPPPRQHQHQHQHRPSSSNGLGKQLDRIRDSSNSQNNMLIAAAVVPSTSTSSTTALVTVPQTPATTTTTTTTTTTSTTTTLMPLVPVVQKQHVETHGGHHHHHHHEHQQQQQQQQQQQHSATVAPGEDLDLDQNSQISSSVLIPYFL